MRYITNIVATIFFTISPYHSFACDPSRSTHASDSVVSAITPVFSLPQNWKRIPAPKEVASLGIRLVISHKYKQALIGLGVFSTSHSLQKRADIIGTQLARLGITITHKKLDKNNVSYTLTGPKGSRLVGRIHVRLVTETAQILSVGLWPSSNRDSFSAIFNSVVSSTRLP